MKHKIKVDSSECYCCRHTLLVACPPASKEVPVDATCDDFINEKHISKEVEVALAIGLGAEAVVGGEVGEPRFSFLAKQALPFDTGGVLGLK